MSITGIKEILSLYCSYNGTLEWIKSVNDQNKLIDNPIAIEQLCFKIGNKTDSKEIISIIIYLESVDYNINYNGIGIGATKIGNTQLLELLYTENKLDYDYILGWFDETEDMPNKKAYNYLVNITKTVLSNSLYDGTLVWLQKKEVKNKLQNTKTSSISLSYFVGNKITNLEEAKLIIEWLIDGEYIINYNHMCMGAAAAGNIDLLEYLNDNSWLCAERILNYDLSDEIKKYLEEVNETMEKLIRLGETYADIESDDDDDCIVDRNKNFNNTDTYMRDMYEHYKNCWYDEWSGWKYEM